MSGYIRILRAMLQLVGEGGINVRLPVGTEIFDQEKCSMLLIMKLKEVQQSDFRCIIVYS